LIATTISEQMKVSLSDETAAGLEIARQNESAPPSVDRQATAASGTKTISPR
jgi:hypothetical protein